MNKSKLQSSGSDNNTSTELVQRKIKDSTDHINTSQNDDEDDGQEKEEE